VISAAPRRPISRLYSPFDDAPLLAKTQGGMLRSPLRSEPPALERIRCRNSSARIARQQGRPLAHVVVLLRAAASAAAGERQHQRERANYG
jgi:hypothetical protein